MIILDFPLAEANGNDDCGSLLYWTVFKISLLISKKLRIMGEIYLFIH